jgi:large subunit ribosomal protein L9
MAHAEIILTENVPNLGAEADVVKVRRGYARNFLLPTGKAIEATAASVRQINALKAKRAEREARELTAAEELARKLGKLTLTFALETGQAGRAFGSVTAKDIQDKISELMPDLELARHAVVLEKAIKETGDHEVSVKLHPEVSAKIRVTITAPLPEDRMAEEETPSRPARKRRSVETAADA